MFRSNFPNNVICHHSQLFCQRVYGESITDNIFTYKEVIGYNDKAYCTLKKKIKVQTLKTILLEGAIINSNINRKMDIYNIKIYILTAP